MLQNVRFSEPGGLRSGRYVISVPEIHQGSATVVLWWNWELPGRYLLHSEDFRWFPLLGRTPSPGPNQKCLEKVRNPGIFFPVHINVSDNNSFPKYTKYEAQRSNMKGRSLTQIVSDLATSTHLLKLPIPERLLEDQVAFTPVTRFSGKKLNWSLKNKSFYL